MRYLLVLPLLLAACCACSSDEESTGSEKFRIELTAAPTATTVTVTATPTDKEAEYTLYVVEASEYDPTNTPADALHATGDRTETFGPLTAATRYLAVAEAPLENYRTTAEFTTGSLPAQEGSGERDGYRLVWQDLFDGEKLDTDTWNIQINGNGNGNAELQYYRAENISIENEPVSGRRCLTITARREDYASRKFTSGRINSMGKKFFKHGKIEAYIRAPKTADGLWPAFWMMGNDYNEVGWPRCCEIDIMEMGNSQGINTKTQDRFFNGACHWGFYKDGAYPNYAKSTTAEYSLQDDFHLFTLIWDDQNLSMYLDLDKNPDAQPYYQMGISDTDGDWATGNYFHKDCFILFNLAVGGYFTGILDPDRITGLPEGEARMYVDYVRVYQKQ